MLLPQIADELRALARDHHIPRLAELADAIRRRPSKRGPRGSVRMTPEIAQEIRAFRATHPDISQQKIAELFHVNSGRVSEALHGKRK